MLTRPVQNVLQFIASRYNLVLMLSSVVDFVTSTLYLMMMMMMMPLANSSTLFSLYVNVNVMNSTLKLVAVLHYLSDSMLLFLMMT